jgi:predicted GH43/DUF377 family glycosyl hydrolase
MHGLAWQRVLSEPFLGPQPHTMLSEAVTTPDILLWHGQPILYVGAVHEGHERLMAVSLPDKALRYARALVDPQATVAVNISQRGFDSEHVFDPAAVIVDDKIYLYYSAVGAEEDQIGLAISADGHMFEKHPQPVLIGRAPEVFRFKGRLYVFFVRSTPGGGYAIFPAVSDDGKGFVPLSAQPVIGATRPPAWDSYEVTTPRLFERHGVVYMLYAASGDPKLRDKPVGFGLARSSDLIQWERYPHNPVFRTGDPGTWDDGAIWFGTVFEWEERLYLLYEGGSTEAMASSLVLTQVGLAVLDGEAFDKAMFDW